MVVGVSPVDPDGAGGAGDGDDHVGVCAGGQAAEEALDGRGIRWVADEPVGEVVRPAVGGARVAHADVGPAGASGILQGGERSGGQDGERPHGAATKRTHAPGRSRAGGSRSTSNRAASVRPISCQPPGELRG